MKSSSVTGPVLRTFVCKVEDFLLYFVDKEDLLMFSEQRHANKKF